MGRGGQRVGDEGACSWKREIEMVGGGGVGLRTWGVEVGLSTWVWGS